jgi:hypothetical protein
MTMILENLSEFMGIIRWVVPMSDLWSNVIIRRRRDVLSPNKWPMIAETTKEKYVKGNMFDILSD